ncbi:MAG TPA: cyclic peptide export ABC transporter [Chitinophaga sp.]|uniref:cyclic peptide export ABC transporter n=1 Tax=Chitinophaga sp. TaxID=1869181 RepID=UPI002B55F592|nr:cyclic peptide export ABC transporter [Chitinophaga sp.]HVI44935.1 cyclic peptide export ABC transporter [Chitinophaga sp.]
MKQLLSIILPRIGRMGALKYTALGILSGMCSFLFINCVTRVAGQIIAGNFKTVSIEYILVFALIILFFIWIRKTLSTAVISISQRLFWQLRKQIIALVLKAKYRQLADKEREVYAAMVSDVNTLTDASRGIIEFFTALVLAICCLVYLSTISLALWGITLVIALLGISVYHLNSRKNLQDIERSRGMENDFVGHLNDILGGFKEIYMEPGKGQYIYDHSISPIAKRAYRNNVSALNGLLINQITGQVLFYVLIASVLLFFGLKLHIPANDLVSYIFTLLYLLGAIETIMVLLPNIVRAGVAADHMISLKNQLEDTVMQQHMPKQYIGINDFQQITVSRLEFSYGEKDQSFSIGPVSLQINKGDVIFIYGGNGSGKTTFVNALLGLCTPSAGEIRLNGELVDGSNYPDYRTAFAVIFSDFFLFNGLLTEKQADMEKWNDYLRLFELENKVVLEEGRYSTTSLSAGQRKRLALIAALMEEKPLLVLDEWAADQDPYFRNKFYTEIIPMLRKSGFTIVAITHDDKYYHCADKLYKMDEGRLERENADAANLSLNER